MERWQLSIYWPNVISIVRDHVHTPMAVCVCVCVCKYHFVCLHIRHPAQLL